MLETSREHDVAVDPVVARGQLRERHADLKRDPSLLGQDAHRAEGLDRDNDMFEQRTDLRPFAAEMVVELVATTRMRLIAVREIATALIATPERWCAHLVTVNDTRCTVTRPLWSSRRHQRTRSPSPNAHKPIVSE